MSSSSSESEDDSGPWTRKPYSECEDDAIIDYIIENDSYNAVKGVNLWKEMAIVLSSHEISNRTWQSLKERFRKVLVPKLKDIVHNPEVLSKLLKAYTLEEDTKIIEYVFNSKYVRHIRGNSFWRQMHRKNIVPGRSWESLRSRLFHISRHTSAYLDEKETKRLQTIWRGEKYYSSSEDDSGSSKTQSRPDKEPSKRESDGDESGSSKEESDEPAPSKPRWRPLTRSLLKFPVKKQSETNREAQKPERSAPCPTTRSKRKNVIYSSDSDENTAEQVAASYPPQTSTSKMSDSIWLSSDSESSPSKPTSLDPPSKRTFLARRTRTSTLFGESNNTSPRRSTRKKSVAASEKLSALTKTCSVVIDCPVSRS